MWRANDARVPIEVVVAVINGSEHRLTLQEWNNARFNKRYGR